MVMILLQLLGLEDDVEEAAEQTQHGEGATDESADGGDELVPVLALPGDHHSHRRDVVAEASLGHLLLRILPHKFNKATQSMV